MKIVKAKIFVALESLVRFINENNISKEDVLNITETTNAYTLFFYSDPEIKEITHGLFS